jgi:hypothetical protein
MSHATEMLENHPAVVDVDERQLAAALEACFEASQTATACADACLAEEQMLVRCIRACLDASDLCGATGRVLSRVTEIDWRVARSAVETCAIACHAAAEECERHEARQEHCRICAEVCRRCEESCAQLLGAIAAVQ